MDLNIIFQEFSNSNHHAFLIETKKREEIFDYFQNKLKTNNYNNVYLNLQILDTDKARELIEFGKINFEEKVFVVLSFYSINIEAQNVLLKFLEETPKNIKVVLIVHSGINIIDTISSRVYRINTKEGDEERSKNTAEIFLKTKKLSRMKLNEIVEMLAKKDEYAEEFEGKERIDRENIEKFLLSIHEVLFEKIKKDPSNKNLIKELEETREFIKYIKNNSSSGKAILEFLSLRLSEMS